MFVEGISLTNGVKNPYENDKFNLSSSAQMLATTQATAMPPVESNCESNTQIAINPPVPSGCGSCLDCKA